MAQRIDEVVDIDPKADAMSVDGTWWAWGDVRRSIDELTSTLPAAPIGLIPRNRPSHVSALLALLSTRRTAVMINPLQAEGRLAAQITDLRLAALVADQETWAREDVLAAARATGTLGVVLTDDPAAPVAVAPGTAYDASVDHRPLSPDVAVEMLTSGTTGEPKRIPLTYGNMERAQLGARQTWSGRGDDAARLRTGVVIVPLSFVHVSGLFNVLATVLDGRRLALLERFEVEPWARLVEEHRPKTAGLPPTALRMVYDAGIAPQRLASLRVLRAGTAPLDPVFAEAFERRYDIPIVAVYGATEFSGGIPIGWTLPLHEEWMSRKRGAAGRVLPGSQVRVVDADTDTELPRGDVGRLEIRAPYLAGVAEDAWVRTTDLAILDEDDFVWIKGRADDVLIRGGFKVAPGTVKGALEAHPAVSEAAVVALPDERLGQVPAAAVELRPDQVVDADELAVWCRERLAPYEVPTRIMIVASLPRTASMKVSALRVQELFEA